MASSIKREVLAIIKPTTRVNEYNVTRWANWGTPDLDLRIVEQQDFKTLLSFLLSEGYEGAWIADASYTPSYTSFVRLLSRHLRDGTAFSVFSVARPQFIRSFHEPKFTADHDLHDKFGGLRYVDLKLVLENYDTLSYDMTFMGSNIDYVSINCSKVSFPYSVFQLSSGEPVNVIENNFGTIQRIYPSVLAKNFSLPILNSHKQLAEMSHSEMFFVMDADLVLGTELTTELFHKWETNYTHVWYAENPINGLVYGHGGPKAFNVNAFKELPQSVLDVTTTSAGRKLVVHKICVGIHAFNWSAESTWRTAFRECAKLYWMLESDDDAPERLAIWCTEADEDANYWKYCLDGANAGCEWAQEEENIKNRSKINDFDWLHQRYEEKCDVSDGRMAVLASIANQFNDLEDEDEEEDL